MPKSSSYRSSKPGPMTSGSHDQDQEQEPFFAPRAGHSFFQPKLSIGQPNDKFEKEADNVADKVIQRLATPMEDENFATNDERMKRDRELREKPEVQLKCSHCEEEDGSSGNHASSSLTSRINSSSGKGTALPSNALAEMQSSFGRDFSEVNIHTDADAVSMNRELGAQAFTHGSDIYFNTGKFNPGSSSGKHLLAHELTHVVQQDAAVRTKPDPARTASRDHDAAQTATTTHCQPLIQRQVTDPIPEAKNQFYGHGAFMGAAPQLMADPKWNRILKALMPDVHAAASKTISKGADSYNLIVQLENNPVMAAYGMYKTMIMDKGKQHGKTNRIANIQAMEWDVFLPARAVEDFKKATTDDQKRRLAEAMVTDMIIAHGTLYQTLKENAGLRQYENVKETEKADKGGVRPGAWMDLFGKALELATDSDWKKKAEEYEDPKLHPRIDSPDDKAADKTFRDPLPFQQVVELYKKTFKKDRFSVLLDIKSHDATPAVMTAVIGELNRRGVYVYGVGSFEHDEIKGLNKTDQTVGGKPLSGPKEIKFFHLAGDLQTACLSKKIQTGDIVMFNAGSLISYDRIARGKQKKESYAIKTEVVSQLRQYKDYYGFRLGVYVQENDIDDKAAAMLTELTNSRPDIFDLGFAWGGLSGQTASDIEPTLTHVTVGYYRQDQAGTQWDTSKPRPPSSPSKEVPLINEFTYQEAERLIHSKKFAWALDLVMGNLIDKQEIDASLFKYELVSDLHGQKGQTGLNEFVRIPFTNKLLPHGPSHMHISSLAFTNVAGLVSSIMLQYQFVLQQTRHMHDIDELVPEAKHGKREESHEGSQVESYLWAMEHLKETGLAQQPNAIQHLYNELTKFYNILGQYSPSHQREYTARYEAAGKLAHPITK